MSGLQEYSKKFLYLSLPHILCLGDIRFKSCLFAARTSSDQGTDLLES